MVKIGILGTANIAKRYLIPAMLELPKEIEVFGVASRTIDKAKEFARELGIEAFEGYDQLISKPIDAVYIPLPNSLHYQWVKTALDNGKHVLVEKSLACGLNEIVELVDLAQRNNLALVENFQFRFHKQLEVIQSVLSSGEIGELRSLTSSFGFPPFEDRQNIRYQKSLGGGALLDAGAYPIKIAQVFLGNDLKISSANLNNQSDREVDIWGGAYLKQSKGEHFAQVAFGFDHFYQCNLELWGSKGSLSARRIFTAPPSLKPEIEIHTANGLRRVEIEEDNHFKNMLQYFCEVIRDDKLREIEYEGNINQGRLLSELRTIAHGG